MKENIVFADSKCFTILNKKSKIISTMSKGSDVKHLSIHYFPVWFFTQKEGNT
jgi:hypothetical protein